MKGATDSDRRESSVPYRMEPKHTRDPASRTTRRLAVRGTRAQITSTPQKRLPTPFLTIGGDTEWVVCSRGSLVVRGTRDARDLYASPLIRRRAPDFALSRESMAPACGSMAIRLAYRRRSTHDSQTRCAWHPCCASLGVPPTAQRSGVVGVLMRILSNPQALTGRHASFPTRRDEACFALKGSKSGARLRINCNACQWATRRPRYWATCST